MLCAHRRWPAVVRTRRPQLNILCQRRNAIITCCNGSHFAGVEVVEDERPLGQRQRVTSFNGYQPAPSAAENSFSFPAGTVQSGCVCFEVGSQSSYETGCSAGRFKYIRLDDEPVAERGDRGCADFVVAGPPLQGWQRARRPDHFGRQRT